MPKLKLRPARRQHGVALLEALVAILLLAVGVLGVLGVQLRTLADTQTGVRRAQAVRAIEDLAERIRSNPDGFGQLRAGNYLSGWSAVGATDNTCGARPCGPAELARWDVMQWKSALATALPKGRANVFASADEGGDAGNRRQLGVMIGWRKNERANPSADEPGDVYSAPCRVSGAGIECPEDLICHLVYVQP